MSNCIFCQIIKKEKPADIVFEDDKVLVMIDIDWVVKGHLLIIWKKHCLNVTDLTEKEFEHFSKVFYKAEKAVLEFTNKARSMILKSGILVSHFHFHIYPADDDIKWEELRDLIEKKVKYEPSKKEEKELIKNLREKLKS